MGAKVARKSNTCCYRVGRTTMPRRCFILWCSTLIQCMVGPTFSKFKLVISPKPIIYIHWIRVFKQNLGGLQLDSSYKGRAPTISIPTKEKPGKFIKCPDTIKSNGGNITFLNYILYVDHYIGCYS